MSTQDAATVIPRVVDQANSVHIDDEYSEEDIVSTEANVNTSTGRTGENVHTSTSSTEENSHTSTASLTVKIDGLEFEIETSPSIPTLSDYATYTKKDRLSMKREKLNDMFERMT